MAQRMLGGLILTALCLTAGCVTARNEPGEDAYAIPGSYYDAKGRSCVDVGPLELFDAIDNVNRSR